MNPVPPTSFFQPRVRPGQRHADLRVASLVDGLKHVLALAHAQQASPEGKGLDR